MAREIATIAREINVEWHKRKGGIHYTAAPYLRAMATLHSVNDHYFEDDARSVILYFLSNASTYRGPVAKAHKAELKAIIGAS